MCDKTSVQPTGTESKKYRIYTMKWKIMKKGAFLIVILLISVINSGCESSTYTHIGSFSDSPKLDLATSIGIVTPEDGVYETRIYKGSGKNTANIIIDSFSRHLNQVENIGVVSSMEEATEKAKKLNLAYIINTWILHWEDRATEWSGITDKVKVKMNLVETSSGQIIDSVLIDGKSSWFTFGGDHPQDFLSKGINKYVSSLFDDPKR